MRRGNEDNLHADANEHRGLFIVADGMGGHAAGEIASQMAVDVLSSELKDVNDLTSREAENKLSEALKLARDVEDRWKQAEASTDASMRPSADDINEACRALLAIDPKDVEYPRAWAAFARLQKIGRDRSAG